MNKSKWEEYKEKMGATRPWDLLNPNSEHVVDAERDRRYDICIDCPEFIRLTKQCKQCGCLMNLKTRLAASSCPIGKW
jgi:hypothetical protein